MKTVILALVSCVFLVGCNTKSATSMNKKMAYADSGAVLAAAVAIDQIPQDKFDDRKAEIIKMCEDLKKFLDDGLIADLPVDKAKTAIQQYMIKKGWSAYVSMIEILFAWIETQQVQVDKIGANNILIIKQGLDGIQRQAIRAKKEWAVPAAAQQVDTTKGRSLTIK